MTQLEGCIRFWESTLKSTGYLIEPSTEVLIKGTIKYLEELREKEVKDEATQG